MKLNLFKITLLCFILFSCDKMIEADPKPSNSSGTSNTGTSGTSNTGSNGNSGSNNQVKPIASFTINNYECVSPCQIQFTNQSSNISGYSFKWDFGESVGLDLQDKLFVEQRLLANPYYIYYSGHNKKVYPRLDITLTKDGGAIASTALQTSINVFAPQGLGETNGGTFRPDQSSNGNIRVKTIFKTYVNILDAIVFDIEVSESKNPRVPNGIYRRGKPEDQPKLYNYPKAPYYLTTDQTKIILIGTRDETGTQKYADAFIFKDSKGQIGYSVAGNGPFGL